MLTLTPAERRGALVVLGLLALGTVHDLWRLRVARAPELPALAPGRSADSARRAPLPEGTAAAAPAGRIDLNRATAEELDTLPGIGPVLAGRIVAHRRAHGPFREPEDLLAVRGIGPKLFARLRSRIAVSPPSAGP